MSATALRWLVLGGTVAAFLVASKAHGRQVRLEREFAGHFQVVFGGHNPPFVEALWHRERLVFWTVAALAGLALAAYVLAAPRLGMPLPLTPASVGRLGGWAVPFVVLWSMIAAFVVSGLLSLSRLAGALSQSAPALAEGHAWKNAAISGSVFWWAATLAAAVALLAAAWPRSA